MSYRLVSHSTSSQHYPPWHKDKPKERNVDNNPRSNCGARRCVDIWVQSADQRGSTTGLPIPELDRPVPGVPPLPTSRHTGRSDWRHAFLSGLGAERRLGPRTAQVRFCGRPGSHRIIRDVFRRKLSYVPGIWRPQARTSGVCYVPHYHVWPSEVVHECQAYEQTPGDG